MKIELILVFLTLISGIIYLLDLSFWRKRRCLTKKKIPIYIDYANSFFPVFIIVLIIRSFIFQPYAVPTGSMEPTISPIEVIFVSQFSYGVRLPLIYTKILETEEPQRGDVAVFRYPPKPSISYIKRIIGIPNDHIQYVDKKLFVNGELLERKLLKEETITTDSKDTKREIYSENLSTKNYQIIITEEAYENERYEFQVPPNYYFVLGDNRDKSADSRYFGLVHEKYLIGQAHLILFSFNKKPFKIRWERIGDRLYS